MRRRLRHARDFVIFLLIFTDESGLDFSAPEMYRRPSVLSESGHGTSIIVRALGSNGGVVCPQKWLLFQSVSVLDLLVPGLTCHTNQPQRPHNQRGLSFRSDASM